MNRQQQIEEIDRLLDPFQYFGVQLGLDRVRRLMAELGNPQERVPIVHVAGTNGKGSVCAYLASVLHTAGYRVGRYTSPHLIDWTERICLGDRPIPAADLAAVLRQVIAAIPKTGEPPTLFEIVTAAAWVYFEREAVDLAVVEVGLGGRLDATNLSDRPLVCAIVSLGRDHWQRLGPTLAHIAREKAGILKPERPAVIGPLPPEAETVVRDRIQALRCPSAWVQPATPVSIPDDPRPHARAPWAAATATDSERETGEPIYPLPLLGDVQLTNSAVAIAALRELQRQGWKLPREAIVEGMGRARWPGRLQWVKWRDRPLLLDGAHNLAAARALRQYVDTQPSPTTWIVGILASKDYDEILHTLLRPGDAIATTAVPGHDSADPDDLLAIAGQHVPLAAGRRVSKLTEALAWGLGDSQPRSATTVCCGSLYLVGQLLSEPDLDRHPTQIEG